MPCRVYSNKNPGIVTRTCTPTHTYTHTPNEHPNSINSTTYLSLIYLSISTQPTNLPTCLSTYLPTCHIGPPPSRTCQEDGWMLLFQFLPTLWKQATGRIWSSGHPPNDLLSCFRFRPWPLSSACILSVLWLRRIPSCPRTLSHTHTHTHTHTHRT
jgi:hypothetical protein